MKNNRFGNRFREARTDARKTIGETARHLSLAITYLSDVERGTRPPLSPDRIRVACDFFGIDPSSLLAEAAAQQGGFRMSAAGLSDKGMHAMAALQRGLPEFDDAFFDELIRITEQRKPRG